MNAHTAITAAHARVLLVDFIEVAMPTAARPGCSACDTARSRLDAAIAAVRPVLDEIGVEVQVRDLRVATEAEARLLRLTASPTIRIGGVEVAPEHGEGEARVWRWRGDEHALPPKAMLLEALLAAAAKPEATPRAEYEVPAYLRRFLGEAQPAKRLHVHVAVGGLAEAVRFYTTLFAAEPTVLKDDYAKWMLDDPRVNFAISARGAAPGVEHLGIQVGDEAGLADVYDRLSRADAPVLEEGATTCCYAKSEKSWITDPAGVPWEVFRTFGDSAVYGGGSEASDGRLATTETGMVVADGGCCAPAEAAAAPKPAAACCG